LKIAIDRPNRGDFEAMGGSVDSGFETGSREAKAIINKLHL